MKSDRHGGRLFGGPAWAGERDEEMMERVDGQTYRLTKRDLFMKMGTRLSKHCMCVF